MMMRNACVAVYLGMIDQFQEHVFILRKEHSQ